jgi:hypothetical protein
MLTPEIKVAFRGNVGDIDRNPPLFTSPPNPRRHFRRVNGRETEVYIVEIGFLKLFILVRYLSDVDAVRDFREEGFPRGEDGYFCVCFEGVVDARGGDGAPADNENGLVFDLPCQHERTAPADRGVFGRGHSVGGGWGG